MAEQGTRRGRGRDARTKAIEETFVALKIAMGSVVGRLRPGPRRGGLSFPQMGVLRFIDHKGTTTPNEMAETFGVTPANITGLVAKLERAGLVRRVRDEEDRRVVRLSLTPKAQRGMERWRHYAVVRLKESFAEWSTGEILTLKGMLERLAPREPRNDAPAQGDRAPKKIRLHATRRRR